MNAELAWLADERPEPEWPAFPFQSVRRRRGIQLSGGRERQDTLASQRSRPDEYTDHQAAALWLRSTGGLFDVVQRPWIREIIQAYAGWTATANGAELEAYERVDNPPREWNEAYFDLLTNCLPEFTLPEISQLALTPIRSLPDEAFFDVTTTFLRSVDGMYFSDPSLPEDVVISIRDALADRLMASGGWKRLGESRSDGIEIHIGPAIAVHFFNDHGFAQSANGTMPFCDQGWPGAVLCGWHLWRFPPSYSGPINA